MTIGTPPKDIKLMPAFHTHRTFITSSSCSRCKSQIYDPKNSSSSQPGTPGPLSMMEFMFDHYGKRDNGFKLTGEPLRDQMCLKTLDYNTKNMISFCTDQNKGHEFFSIHDF